MFIDGRQIILRDKRLEDLPVEIRWMQKGHRWQELDAPYYPHDVPSQADVDKARQRLSERIAANDWPDPRRQLIIALKSSNLMIGVVTWYWISEETDWPALGIVIYDPDWWGRGVGYEAFGLWSDYLFNCRYQFIRLDLRTWSGNKGMMRLAEKLGYQQEARFRKARIVEGEYYDGLGYGILREEWEARYPGGFAAHL